MTFDAKHINFGLNYGGLGDAIARAPAVKAVLEDYPNLELTLFVFEAAVDIYQTWFGHHPRVRNILPLNKWNELADDALIINFDFTRHLQLGMHLTTHGHLTLAQTMPRRPLYYLPLGKGARPAPGESKLIALTPNFTALSRSLPPAIWVEIQEHILARGYTPLLLGATGVEFGGISHVEALPGAIDLRDRTTLLQAAEWMEKSVAVIGLDNGLIHLAGCTDTPIIVAYSTQIPEYRIPVRERGAIKTLLPRSSCQGCETWLRFHENQFKRCYYGTYECVRSFTAKDFTDQLEEYL